ncbi:hypothetical protein [Paenibacillus sp. DMB5]|nr:hypothetical protein [Paenibacillus sp. DMB5]
MTEKEELISKICGADDKQIELLVLLFQELEAEQELLKDDS